MKGTLGCKVFEKVYDQVVWRNAYRPPWQYVFTGTNMKLRCHYYYEDPRHNLDITQAINAVIWSLRVNAWLLFEMVLCVIVALAFGATGFLSCRKIYVGIHDHWGSNLDCMRQLKLRLHSHLSFLFFVNLGGQPPKPL